MTPAIAPSTETTVSELLLGEYEVERPLGAGGMGHVVLVRSRSTGQRFAVKRAHPHGPDARPRLLTELQTWIDLPEFPHLVACRFFRTIGDAIAIFAEYVAGGSLADALADGRLTELPRILDIAIQLARGLHAAHRLGVVHQDVKPGNVLLTLDGIVKVGDFGLARAALGSGARFGGTLTRGYCSPEQAELAARTDPGDGRLTPASDQWSWGVTVLELFTGTPPCRYGGQLAASVLESFLAQGGQEPPQPAMPTLVAEVLRKCFQRRPDDRWPSLDAAADILAIAYQFATGTPYPRAKPDWPTRPGSGERSRRTLAGDPWDDPLDWLRRVLVAAGEDPSGAAAFVTPATGSRRARAVADLVPFEVAHQRLTHLCQRDRPDLEPLLAELCLARAVVHWAAEDVPGTAGLAEQAAGLLAPRVASGAADLAPLLIEAYLRGAACARLQGRLADALDLAGRAIAVCEGQGTPPAQRLGTSYLRACASRARTFFAREDYPAALADLERGRIMGEALLQAGRTDLEPELVELDLQTARALKDSGEPVAATAWLDRALPRLERLALEAGDAPLLDQLASAYLTRARLLSLRDDLPAAARDGDRALTLWRDLAAREDRPELAGDLAEALLLQANVLTRQDRGPDALPLYEQAVTILERFVGPLGRTEYLPRLAHVCLNHAIALRVIGDHAAAFSRSERALAILEPLAGERPDLASDLAWAHGVHARGQLALGQAEPALASWRIAVVLYEQLVQVGGRWDLLPSLLRAQGNEAHVLAQTGRIGAALERLDQSLRCGEALANLRETPDLVLELAAMRIDHAELLIADGQMSQAQARLCEVMLRLEHESEAEALRQRALDLLGKLW